VRGLRLSGRQGLHRDPHALNSIDVCGTHGCQCRRTAQDPARPDLSPAREPDGRANRGPGRRDHVRHARLYPLRQPEHLERCRDARGGDLRRHVPGVGICDGSDGSLRELPDSRRSGHGPERVLHIRGRDRDASPMADGPGRRLHIGARLLPAHGHASAPVDRRRRAWRAALGHRCRDRPVHCLHWPSQRRHHRPERCDAGHAGCDEHARRAGRAGRPPRDRRSGRAPCSRCPAWLQYPKAHPASSQ